MATPEFARIAWNGKGTGRGQSVMTCPCSARFEPGSWYYLCDKDGTDNILGSCLKCAECGRILSADGVVIGRVSIPA